MKIYEINPKFTETGDRYAHWADDDGFLVDVPLHRIQPLTSTWPTDLHFRLITDRNDCDVLFNPDATLFGASAKALLSEAVASCAEWLPVHVEGQPYSLLHPLVAVDPGPGIQGSVNSVSGNMTSITRFDFSELKEAPPVFQLQQLEGSAAWKNGLCIGVMLVNEQVAEVMSQIDGIQIDCVYDDRQQDPRPAIR